MQLSNGLIIPPLSVLDLGLRFFHHASQISAERETDACRAVSVLYIIMELTSSPRGANGGVVDHV